MLRHFFLPTTTESYQQDDQKYRSDHDPKIRALKDELETVKEVIELVRSTRSTIVKGLKLALHPPSTNQDPQGNEFKDWKCMPIPSRQSSLESKSSDWQTDDEKALPSTNSLVSDLCGTIKEVNLLKSYAEDLEKSIDRYEYLVNTQATADRTGYRELRDWAKDMLRRFESLNTVLISISTVGAGLVYATIFSASRGNIDLMALTFPFFTIGFVFPIAFQIGMRWASNPPNPVQFASQRFWKYMINALMMFASLAVLAALIVLNVTVFLLNPVSDPSCSCLSAVSSSVVSISGIVTSAVSGSAFLVFACALILSVTAKGLKATIRPWHTKTLNISESFKYA